MYKYNFTHHFNSKPLFPSATCSGLDLLQGEWSAHFILAGRRAIAGEALSIDLPSTTHGQRPRVAARRKGGPAARASLSTAPQAKKGAPISIGV
jgi:hypothetical protein